jgi:hypothetical protein
MADRSRDPTIGYFAASNLAQTVPCNRHEGSRPPVAPDDDHGGGRVSSNVDENAVLRLIVRLSARTRLGNPRNRQSARFIVSRLLEIHFMSRPTHNLYPPWQYAMLRPGF